MQFIELLILFLETAFNSQGVGVLSPQLLYLPSNIRYVTNSFLVEQVSLHFLFWHI